MAAAARSADALDTRDYRSGVDQIMGFSCKSDIDAASTLFNASGDNTNFEYELVGDMNDEIMDRFNSLYKEVVRKGVVCRDVATSERMNYLKSCGIDVKFIQTAKQTAGQNLVRSGGLETPLIVAEMLKYYYYNKSGTDTSVDESVRYLADKDVIGYGFGNLYDTYHLKVANLLYAMFTGLRFSKPWNGKSDVSGGYICHLNIILLCSFRCQEVYFLAVIVIHIYLVSHIKQLVVNDIFKVMRKIKTVVHTTDRIETNIGIIDFRIVRKLFFCFRRILLDRFNNIRFFQVAKIFHYGIDRAARVFLLDIVTNGACRENTAIATQDEIYQALKQTFFAYLVSSD